MKRSNKFAHCIRLAVIVTAGFALVLPVASVKADAVTLTVTQNGTGVVTSSPAGINCGSDCTEVVNSGDTITLTATPGAGMQVKQWTLSNYCSEGGYGNTCTTTMSAYDREMKVTYEYTSYALDITKTGSGSGTVTGTGINCGSDCSETLAKGSYTLTASASSDSTFVGWEATSICGKTTGKGSFEMNTSPSCTFYGGGTSSSGTATAKFDKNASASTPTSTSVPNTTTTTQPSTPSSTPTSTPATPEAPTLETTKIDGSTASSQEPIKIDQSEPIVLSGHTVANGAVTLTIHSDPRTVTTKADESGNWSYTITGLEPGDHYVEASVTDPATSQTSPVVKLLSFTVNAATPKAIVAKKQSSVPWIVFAVATVVVLGGGGWFAWKKWRAHKATQSPAINES